MSSWSRYIFAIFGFAVGSLLTSVLIVNREVMDAGDRITKILDSPPAPSKPNITSLSPMIFVGGFPRSGTTLMRVLLEAHPDVRCGPETRVIPRLLNMYQKWMNSIERKRLSDAGILGEPLDKATAAFILEIIQRNGRLAPRLCNKDPLALRQMKALSQFFPNSKFVLMVRDGRAVAHSVMKRRVTISGVDVHDPWSILKHWDKALRRMVDICNQVNEKSIGAQRCLKVFYEKLVLHPEPELRRISNFLDLSWSPNFLNHDKSMKNYSRSYLSRSEKSTDQVVRPINIKSLTEWCSDGVLPHRFIYNAHKSSTLLELLDYDVRRVPPFYGVPDSLVKQNTERLAT